MLKPETIKVFLAASIVITAFAIMLQGVLGFVFSLARLGLIIVIAVLVSSGLAFMYQFLIKGKKALNQTTNELDEEKLEAPKSDSPEKLIEDIAGD